MFTSTRFPLAASCACAAVLLAACGGGSGGASTPEAALESITDVQAPADTSTQPVTNPTAPAPSTAAGWEQCAAENSVCNFSGRREVRYGAESSWVTRVADNSIACSNTVFGDPIKGVAKTCEVSDVTTTAPVTSNTSTPAPAPAPAPAPSNTASGPYGQDASQYTLTFSDEFDNGFNTSRWNNKIWYEQSSPTINYAVEDGKLKIWPQRDANGNFVNRTIDTDGKFYQTYGFFEMEAKLPYGKGPWPAFWLLNHDRGHPDRPEIDILEAYSGGGANSGWSDSNLRPTTYAVTVWPKGIEGGSAAGTLKVPNTGDLSAGFHKYAVKWEPNKITFYFDGKAVYTVNASMKDRMYVLLDLWYGSASGQPDNSTPTGKGNSFEVNYVRVWQFK